MITYDDFGFPIVTTTGIRCGNHHDDNARHETVDAVRECYLRWHQLDEDANADHAAEMAAERALEDRGYWDARAQEDWEAANGVIPFDVAFRAALAHA
ncbi:hypothetical protein [Verrucosispora sp. TAA-831]|uniref:hypothetical protein n=1 Tax=Verrucosispora sp. TAA-831 TaxID=3422227 RepID=UPI003D6F1EF1